MHYHTCLPQHPIDPIGQVARAFLSHDILRFGDACGWVLTLPYVSNTRRDDPLVLFRERQGTSATKHAAIATLAGELGLDVYRHLGVYAMTERLVTGTRAILDEFGLPYLPMLHCFLAHSETCVDLTEGNRNGKNGPVIDFLHQERVDPGITARGECHYYLSALHDFVLPRPEFRGIQAGSVLRAREAGLSLLKGRLRPVPPGPTLPPRWSPAASCGVSGGLARERRMDPDSPPSAGPVPCRHFGTVDRHSGPEG
jgi:hypothetical protein